MRRRHPPELNASADAGAFAQLAASLLWLPQAALLAWVVQRLADGAGWRELLAAVLGIGGLGLLRSALDAWGLRRGFHRARQRLRELRERVTAALAATSPLDPERPASGLAASAVAEQAEAVLPALLRYPPVRLRLRVVPGLLLAAVAWHSWVAALILLVAAPLIPMFMAIVGWRAQAASEAQMVELGRLNGFLLDRLRGLPTLRALGAIEATALRLRRGAVDLQRRTMSVLRIAFLSSAVLELFSALGVAMVAVYVGFHLLGQIGFGAWGGRLSLGEGLFVLLLAPAFFEPLRELAAVWHDRAAGAAALETLERLAQPGAAWPGATAREARSAEALGLPPAGSALAVSVHGLRHAHADEDAVFDGFDLQLRPGEHLALTGPSGSGKSTLLALLAGLASPQGGEIRIGGLALRGSAAAALRSRIAWMGQRPHVFAGSLADNVALGRPGIDAGAARGAMSFAGLDEVLHAHPGATLGENGLGLSGGEAVRLALARLAVHADAGLLLVDEPTAHLDSETAARVIDALCRLARGRTMLVATHDPALIARMQRSLQLDARHWRQAA